MSEPAESVQRERYISAIKALIETLTATERLEVFDEYCSECGTDDPSCKCWNDE